MQVQGTDFDEVYAPVGKHATLRTLLAIVAKHDLELHSLDVKTAFLNGKLDEDVYILQPPGFDDGSGKVCKLKRALYGLKQAPRNWHLCLKAALEKLGFVASDADAGLFYTNTADRIYLLSYVDDLLIAGSSAARVDSIKRQLMKVFDMHDLGDATEYLGMKLTRDRAAGTIKLSQSAMVVDILQRYSMSEAKPKPTPISDSTRIQKDGEPLDTKLAPYSSLVGSLLYLSVCTRPDIAWATNVLSKYLSCPTDAHWQLAKGILRYVQGTIDLDITFGLTNDGLLSYTNADYAGDVDTRRSTTGFVITLGGCSRNELLVQPGPACHSCTA